MKILHYIQQSRQFKVKKSLKLRVRPQFHTSWNSFAYCLKMCCRPLLICYLFIAIYSYVTLIRFVWNIKIIIFLIKNIQLITMVWLKVAKLLIKSWIHCDQHTDIYRSIILLKKMKCIRSSIMKSQWNIALNLS